MGGSGIIIPSALAGTAVTKIVRNKTRDSRNDLSERMVTLLKDELVCLLDVDQT
jgi:hypothetical protein